MPTPPRTATHLEVEDLEPEVHSGRGWTTTLRRSVQPLRGARENAHEALLECQARSAQRRAVAGLIPPPRGPAD